MRSKKVVQFSIILLTISPSQFSSLRYYDIIGLIQSYTLPRRKVHIRGTLLTSLTLEKRRQRVIYTIYSSSLLRSLQQCLGFIISLAYPLFLLDTLLGVIILLLEDILRVFKMLRTQIGSISQFSRMFFVLVRYRCQLGYNIGQLDFVTIIRIITNLERK